ncbi:hypothetical protein [Acetobacterium bakii]|uniref:Uncharacterized protein n=1 Tax=Acetobacterium bakii TaxID=52689 RepID=A0A0L6U239_9FIRM|nr:hypothetical protein [Acetobacterium bakii]KNZ42397.1 hypothetical protein AKG39_06380 [Acetobacterium bakii]
MAKLIWEKESGTRYFQDDLLKYKCYGCEKEFIVGRNHKETSEQLICPYCGQAKALDEISECGGECLEELELGCFGIYFTIDKNGEPVTQPIDLFEKELFFNRESMTEEERNTLNVKIVKQIN